MKYEKLNMGSYNLHTITTDKFKTISVKVGFRRKTVKEEITYREFLCGFLQMSSGNFKTKRDFELELENLYDAYIGGGMLVSGNYMLLTYQLKFLNEKYTEKGMNEKTFKFFFDNLLYPNVDGDKLNEEMFNVDYNSYLTFLESIDDYPDSYATRILNKIRGKGTPLEYQSYGYIEDLKKVTPKSLYDYYKSVLEKDVVDIFVVGNIKSDEIVGYLNKYFNIQGERLIDGEHFVDMTSAREEVQVVKEPSKFGQSKLRIGLKVDELDRYERDYVLSVYNFILGGNSDSKLFTELREKRSLCYDASSSFSVIYSNITIYAGIDSKNFDEAVEVVKNILEDMKNGKIDQEVLDTVKVNYISSYKEMEDKPGEVISCYENHEYIHTDLMEDRIKNIEKLNMDMVIKVANKIHLDTIYLLEGVTANDN